ncbi:hypothetical protein FN846DRAFT_954979, partial [Sphaerosporella brunnea]
MAPRTRRPVAHRPIYAYWTGPPNEAACTNCGMWGHLPSEYFENKTRHDRIARCVPNDEIATQFGILDEWKALQAAKQSQDTQMQDTSHEVTSAASNVPLPAIPLADFADKVEELLRRHLAALKEGYDTSLANLVKVVLELKETVEELSVQNRAHQTQLSDVSAGRPGYTTVSHAASQTPPPPPPPLASAETTATPPEVTVRSKRRRAGPPSATVQPAKQPRTISPPPSLMHSKHAGPSTALVSMRPDPETQPAPGNPEADAPPSGGTEAEGGWKKVERKKRRRPSGCSTENDKRGSAPSRAQVARGEGVSINVFIGGAADTKRYRPR